jgi:hypothetical protein
MLMALVLICSILVTPDIRDCTKHNARIVMIVPELFASPVACARHGQAYFAQTAMGQNLTHTDRIKIVCVQHKPHGSEVPKEPQESNRPVASAAHWVHPPAGPPPPAPVSTPRR